MRLPGRGTKSQSTPVSPDQPTAFKDRLLRSKPCKDGVYVGDEVYSTRKDENSVLWTVGTVTAIESTDLLEVDWHSLSLNPYLPQQIAAPRYLRSSKDGHRQWHDRAGVAHIKCRPA
jgi:hypothetical protein